MFKGQYCNSCTAVEFTNESLYQVDTNRLLKNNFPTTVRLMVEILDDYCFAFIIIRITLEQMFPNTIA